MSWARQPVADQYDEDGRRALFVGDQVVVVSELAVTILDALPAHEATIGQALVDRHGPPPGDLAEAVRGALVQLEQLDLVVRSADR